jgi:diadenosine tetraphosphate (Ap4A) HIT family hydrolase
MHPQGRCVLCDEVSGDHALSSLLHAPAYSKKVPLDGGYFLLLPDICPLVLGHHLLMTRDHLCSFAEVPSSRQKGFKIAKDEAIRIITHQFGSPILFEHGTGTGAAAIGACVQHAHIHLLPVQGIPAITEAMEEFGKVFDCSGSDAPLSFPTAMEDYLFYQNREGRGFIVVRPSPPVPQQFIRREIGNYLGLWNWNWKGVFASKASFEISSSGEEGSQILE